MDNILEILVPLIFAAIYFFGNMFGKSNEGEDASPGQPRRRAAEDDDAAERQRNIQEEIRRKIMERRRATEGGQPQAAPVSQEPRKATREVVHGSREVPPPLVTATQEAEAESTSATFSWDESDNAYEDSMQAQLKQIEETKRRAEKLKKQAVKQRETFGETKKAKRKTGGYFTGSVRDSLRDPRAARAAFIYGEVLGQPISLRKGQFVPGLN